MATYFPLYDICIQIFSTEVCTAESHREHLGNLSASRITVSMPSRARIAAVNEPPGPPPTMSTVHLEGMVCISDCRDQFLCQCCESEIEKRTYPCRILYLAKKRCLHHVLLFHPTFGNVYIFMSHIFHALANPCCFAEYIQSLAFKGTKSQISSHLQVC